MPGMENREGELQTELLNMYYTRLRKFHRYIGYTYFLNHEPSHL